MKTIWAPDDSLLRMFSCLSKGGLFEEDICTVLIDRLSRLEHLNDPSKGISMLSRMC